MITTNAHIGNYGTNPNEIESDDMKISALICKNFNKGFSRADANMELNDYFVNQNKVVISDVDTRSLVKYIRDKGAMNAIISSETLDVEELKTKLSESPFYGRIGTYLLLFLQKKSYFVGNENAGYPKVAVLDLGVKRNILKCLTDRGCFLKVFPMHTSYEKMK